MFSWKRWVHQPQDVFLRRALFQIHLWAGIALGLYILVVCLSGSILVYRNELYTYFSPETDGPLPLGFQITAWLLRLHDNLLFGQTGRRVNGFGAMAVLLLCITGAVIWWPGMRSWRRSLTIEWRSNWKRVNWTLHSALGFWCFAFIVMWAMSGIYLSFPDYVSDALDAIKDRDASPAYNWFVRRSTYWLAYSHFGRFGGRIWGCARVGLCDQAGKATWALFGLVPPVMFVTGAFMWWNRVVSPARRRVTSRAMAEEAV